MSFVWFDWKAIYEPWHVFPCWCKRCHHVLHNIYGAGFSISLPHLNKDNTITRCIKLEKAPLYNNLLSALRKNTKGTHKFLSQNEMTKANMPPTARAVNIWWTLHNMRTLRRAMYIKNMHPLPNLMGITDNFALSAVVKCQWDMKYLLFN